MRLSLCPSGRNAQPASLMLEITLMSLVPASAPGHARARVLVVEDEIFIRLDVSEALRTAGFEVIEAESADDAVGFMEAGEPVDVVFTDVQLPGLLDGFDLANMMRATRPSLGYYFWQPD